MIALKSIRITHAEGFAHVTRRYCGRDYPTWAAADEALRAMARHAPKTDGYDKAAIVVTWADGETYEARVDLTYDHAMRSEILRPHMREFLTFASGQRCPVHLTRERYAAYLAEVEQREPGYAAACVRFLTEYLAEPVVDR